MTATFIPVTSTLSSDSPTSDSAAFAAFAAAPRLDERLVRAAVAWSLEPAIAFEEAADELVALARGNRSAVERAIRRVRTPRAPGVRRSTEPDTTSGRATAVLRLALARGSWAW